MSNGFEKPKEAFIGEMEKHNLWQCRKCGRLWDASPECHDSKYAELLGTAWFYTDQHKRYRVSLPTIEITGKI